MPPAGPAAGPAPARGMPHAEWWRPAHHGWRAGGPRGGRGRRPSGRVATAARSPPSRAARAAATGGAACSAPLPLLPLLHPLQRVSNRLKPPLELEACRGERRASVVSEGTAHRQTVAAGGFGLPVALAFEAAL